jgi:hypothetical protein
MSVRPELFEALNQILQQSETKNGKLYSVESNDISKVFFTSHHVGRCCTDVIRRHCCSLGHSWINAIPGHFRLSASVGTMNPVMRSCTLSIPVGSLTPGHAGWVSRRNNDPRSCKLSTPATKGDRQAGDSQTDMDGSIRRSSLTLERGEHLKTLLGYIGYQGCHLNIGQSGLKTEIHVKNVSIYIN